MLGENVGPSVEDIEQQAKAAYTQAYKPLVEVLEQLLTTQSKLARNMIEQTHLMLLDEYQPRLDTAGELCKFHLRNLHTCNAA